MMGKDGKKDDFKKLEETKFRQQCMVAFKPCDLIENGSSSSPGIQHLSHANRTSRVENFYQANAGR